MEGGPLDGSLTAAPPMVPGGVLNYEQNPMLNEVILKNFFDKCSHRQLNRYRRVCKHWYKESLPAWLSKGPPIIFRDYDMMLKFLSDMHMSPPDEEEDEHEDVVQGIRKYRKFIMESGLENVNGVFDYESRSLGLFWTKCGPWLTHLTLRKIYVIRVTSLKEVMFCEHTPNLEYLEVDADTQMLLTGHGHIPMIQYDLPNESPDGPGSQNNNNKNLKTLRIDWRARASTWGDELTPFPLDWKLLFEHYPNLKDLGIGRHLSSDQPEMMRIIQAIKDVRSEGEDAEKKLALNSLIYFYNEDHREPHRPGHPMMNNDSRDPLPNEFSDLLRQAQLELEEFRLDFSSNQPDDYMHRVISLYSETCTKLQIHKHLLFERFPVRGGFTHLQQLTLTGAPVKSLTFLSEIPALRSLRLFYSYLPNVLTEEIPYSPDLLSLISTTNRSWQDGQEFPPLVEFCCNYQVAWTKGDIVVLGKWFPGLTRLDLSLNNSTFRLVCRIWPNLEHLTVYRDEVGDKGIVGITWEEGQLSYKEPNITSLQKLRSFAIDDLGRRGHLCEGAFSQLSVFYGFLKLPQLENFTIKVMKMDPEVKEVIPKRIPFAKITANDWKIYGNRQD